MLTELRVVFSMAFMRILAGTIEIIAALLMIKFAQVHTAMKINATLGLIGPTILMVVSSMGLIGLAQEISYSKMIIIALGVLLIFFGTR